jgi:hypothetical protein
LCAGSPQLRDTVEHCTVRRRAVPCRVCVWGSPQSRDTPEHCALRRAPSRRVAILCRGHLIARHGRRPRRTPPGRRPCGRGVSRSCAWSAWIRDMAGRVVWVAVSEDGGVAILCVERLDSRHGASGGVGRGVGGRRCRVLVRGALTFATRSVGVGRGGHVGACRDSEPGGLVFATRRVESGEDGGGGFRIAVDVPLTRS